MTERTVWVKRSGDDAAWEELSKHADRESALDALRATLIAADNDFATARLEPDGERYAQTPQGAVIEVMDD